MRDPRLPRHWHARERCVVLDTDFQQGQNFLSVWDAWQRDPGRCKQLHYIAINEEWPDVQTLADGSNASTEPSSRLQQLKAAWPSLTPNLHLVSLESDRVQLMLLRGARVQALSEIVAQIDCMLLGPVADEHTAPHLFKALARLAAPNALLAALSPPEVILRWGRPAGFVVDTTAPPQDERCSLARYAPHFKPRGAAIVRSAPQGRRKVLIIGGGLAGCAASWALAEQGWQCQVLDRHAGPARETSGNAAGLFHGIVNRQDGAHARFNRAAALQARQAVEYAIQHHGVAGEIKGLLRLEAAFGEARAMTDLLTHLSLPPDYAQALSVVEASRLAEIPLHSPAWFYPGGGWVNPTGLAESYLKRAGSSVEFRGNCTVHAMAHDGTQWIALDTEGQPMASAEALVLCNAGDSIRLLEHPPWPLGTVRGQLSMLPAACVALHGLPSPAVPVAGSGYVLRSMQGDIVFGATSDRGDLDPSVRDADHLRNLHQVMRLLSDMGRVTLDELTGRTGWRWVADDRLPVVGAVPDAQAVSHLRTPLNSPRKLPRVPGLFVFTALGSRGITWSALGARVLAAQITGAPVPLEASLVDAIDPGRFMVRANRRAASTS